MFTQHHKCELEKLRKYDVFYTGPLSTTRFYDGNPCTDPTGRHWPTAKTRRVRSKNEGGVMCGKGAKWMFIMARYMYHSAVVETSAANASCHLCRDANRKRCRSPCKKVGVLLSRWAIVYRRTQGGEWAQKTTWLSAPARKGAFSTATVAWKRPSRVVGTSDKRRWYLPSDLLVGFPIRFNVNVVGDSFGHL